MIEISKAIRRLLQIFSLIVVDLLSFFSVLFAAWLTRVEIMPFLISVLPEFNFSYVYFLSLWWIPAIFIFFISYEGLYTGSLPFWDESKNLIKAVSLASLTVLSIVTLGKMGDIVSRIVLVGVWLLSLLVFPVFRLWSKKLFYSAGFWRERVLILGAGKSGGLVAEGLERERHMGYEIAGFLDDDEGKIGKTIKGKKVLGNVERFPEIVRDLGIRTVIIAMPSLPAERLSTLTASVQNLAVNTVLIPDLKGIALLNTDLHHLFKEEIFLMNIKNNLKSISNRAVKKVFDITVSIFFMPLLLLLIGIIGAAIKIETRGPAIYAHDRIGKNGRRFKCYKFRTMQRDAEERLKEMLESSEDMREEWEKNWKLKDDPRVTKIGRLLRKTSLDELPQIFNVLKGEMSLVGPRPVTQSEIDAHYKDSSRHSFCVSPGITGLWQVSGRNNTSYDYRVRLDTWYVMNWSLWLDIVILFKTLRVVVQREGAY